MPFADLMADLINQNNSEINLIYPLKKWKKYKNGKKWTSMGVSNCLNNGPISAEKWKLL